MDSTLIATAITVFVSLTGGLLWVSYKHPKAYLTLVVPPAGLIALAGILVLAGASGAVVYTHLEVGSMLPAMEADPLSEDSSLFVQRVSGMIGAQRYVGWAFVIVAFVVAYASIIKYIGKTLRESAKDDEATKNVKEPVPHADAE
jgi:hypothetical protein